MREEIILFLYLLPISAFWLSLVTALYSLIYIDLELDKKVSSEFRISKRTISLWILVFIFSLIIVRL